MTNPLFIKPSSITSPSEPQGLSNNIPRVAYSLFVKALDQGRSMAVIQRLEARHIVTLLYSASLVPLLVKDSWLSDMISAVRSSPLQSSSDRQSATLLIALARISSTRLSFKHPSLMDHTFLQSLLEEASRFGHRQLEACLNPPIVLLWSCALLHLRPPLSFLAHVQKSTCESTRS